MMTGTVNGAEQIQILIYLDGVQIIPWFTANYWNVSGFTSASRPFQLNKITVDGVCEASYAFEWGLRFNEKIEIYTNCSSIGNPTGIDAYVYYEESTI